MHIKLRRLREEKRFSQQEMGRLLFISQPQYQRKEAGFVSFTEKECITLGEYFDVPVDQIIEANKISTQIQKNEGGVSPIYNLADRLVDEVIEMNYFFKQELEQKNEKILRLKEKIKVLQSKLKK